MHESELIFGKERFIHLSKPLAREIGLEATALIGELFDEYRYFEANNLLTDGMFFATKDKIEHETTLTRHKIDSAINLLKKFCLIETKLMGIPAKMYFKVNVNNLDSFLVHCIEVEQTSLRKSDNTVCENRTNLVVEDRQSNYEPRKYEPSEEPSLNTPLPPTRGKRSKPEIDFESLPSMTERFETALKKWIKYRKEIKKPIYQTTVETLVKQWRDKERRFVVAVDYTISKGWQGLREPEQSKTTEKRNSTDEFTRILEKWGQENDEGRNTSDYQSDDGCIF